MGDSGSHNFSAITNYWLFAYTKRTLYNIPIGVQYFYYGMNMHTENSILILRIKLNVQIEC